MTSLCSVDPRDVDFGGGSLRANQLAWEVECLVIAGLEPWQALAAATCNGNTREVRQFTAGFYDTVYQGKYGTVKAGVQYSYNQRFAFDGVGGAPRTDDNIVMSQLRYYPFN